MADSSDYTPPKVWTWNKASGGRFANINRPIAGPTHDKELPVGKHPMQLYSLGTPNGQKVTVMLEELLAKGHSGAEYDAWLIKIGEGDQFGSGFVDANPNSKIPALVDRSGARPIRSATQPPHTHPIPPTAITEKERMAIAGDDGAVRAWASPATLAARKAGIHVQ